MIKVKINATVVSVLGEETITFDKEPMRKRTVIFQEADTDYPSQVAVDWWGDKCDLVSAINPDDVVVVEFKVQTRPTRNGKPFTSCVGREIAVAARATETLPEEGEESAPEAETAEMPF